jgi:hypothetical protein
MLLACLQAAAEGSRTLRLLSCERGDAALKAVIAGGTTELMREVVMALAAGKLMQGDQHALFWTLLAYLCSNHTALCIAYLQVSFAGVCPTNHVCHRLHEVISAQVSCGNLDAAASNEVKKSVGSRCQAEP